MFASRLHHLTKARIGHWRHSTFENILDVPNVIQHRIGPYRLIQNAFIACISLVAGIIDKAEWDLES
jgi:hypothetical protein